MGRWYTSDHHFGHGSIIGYCGRPFVDADAMDKEMVARWNDVVADEDEVWILGDLVMGGKARGLAGHVARLKGRKILVPGNHDRCWQGREDHRYERADYYRIGGIDKIIDNPEPHTIAGQTAHLSHFPYKLDSRHDMKFAQWRPQDDGARAPFCPVPAINSQRRHRQEEHTAEKYKPARPSRSRTQLPPDRGNRPIGGCQGDVTGCDRSAGGLRPVATGATPHSGGHGYRYSRTT